MPNITAATGAAPTGAHGTDASEVAQALRYADHLRDIASLGVEPAARMLEPAPAALAVLAAEVRMLRELIRGLHEQHDRRRTQQPVAHDRRRRNYSQD